MVIVPTQSLAGSLHRILRNLVHLQFSLEQATVLALPKCIPARSCTSSDPFHLSCRPTPCLSIPLTSPRRTCCRHLHSLRGSTVPSSPKAVRYVSSRPSTRPKRSFTAIISFGNTKLPIMWSDTKRSKSAFRVVRSIEENVVLPSKPLSRRATAPRIRHMREARNAAP
jgi:hypothetical protein